MFNFNSRSNCSIFNEIYSVHMCICIYVFIYIYICGATCHLPSPPHGKREFSAAQEAFNFAFSPRFPVFRAFSRQNSEFTRREFPPDLIHAAWIRARSRLCITGGTRWPNTRFFLLFLVPNSTFFDTFLVRRPQGAGPGQLELARRPQGAGRRGISREFKHFWKFTPTWGGRYGEVAFHI